MPTESALLAEVPFFQLLDESERAHLADRLDDVAFKKGDVIFKYGDPGDSLYIIRQGEVEAFLRDNTGMRIVLERSVVGDFFGELSLLDGGPRTATVEVMEDLEALRLDRGDLDEFLRLHPAAALDLLTAMGRRLRQTSERLRHTASRNVNEEVEDNRTAVMKAADWISEFSGSIPFLIIHLGLFAIWIALNLETTKGSGINYFGLPAFDPFPFGLLTMVVSLEAIILSVFVLLSQNRQAVKDHVRGDIEYDVNLKAELEVAHLHEKLDTLHVELLRRLEELEKRGGRPA
jgi:uncharacterized membrane protein